MKIGCVSRCCGQAQDKALGVGVRRKGRGEISGMSEK